VQRGHGLLHRVAGAQLRHLPHEHQVRGLGAGFHLVGAVAGHGDDPVGPQLRGGVEHVMQ
jgi:hypothetical protein